MLGVWTVGQLGNSTSGSSAKTNIPVKVFKGVGGSAIPANAVLNSISAGGSTVCATDTDGNAYCWGYGGYGALGNGSTADSYVPVKVVTGGSSAIPSTAKITQISSSKDNSEQTTCAVADGKAYCWGYNGYGALGNNQSGTLTSSSYPITVNAGINGSQLPADAVVTNIQTASYQTCALANGVGYCWGQNDRGQLGNGTLVASNVPLAVLKGGQSAIPAGVRLLNIGTAYDDGLTSAVNSCGMGDNFNIYCWGDNTYGELGVGAIGTPPYSMYPLEVIFP